MYTHIAAFRPCGIRSGSVQRRGTTDAGQSSTRAVEDSRKLQIALAWGAILILAVPTILLRLIVPEGARSFPSPVNCTGEGWVGGA